MLSTLWVDSRNLKRSLLQPGKGLTIYYDRYFTSHQNFTGKSGRVGLHGTCG